MSLQNHQLVFCKRTSVGRMAPRSRALTMGETCLSKTATDGLRDGSELCIAELPVGVSSTERSDRLP